MKICKKIFLLLTIVFLSYGAKAQIGFDYAQYDVGIATGFNTVYGDAQTQTMTQSFHFNFNYNVGPFINYVFELQAGQLKGGDSLATSSGRQFTNNFTAVMVRAQVQAGELMDYSQSGFKNVLKNFYLSTGIGFVVNHITDINRYSILTPGFYTGGDNNSNEILIPVRIGYEFKIFNKYNQPNIKIDIGYQQNFILGDDLDGFIAGTHNDSYGQYTLGVKFAIGGVTSYRKQIYH